MRSNSNAFLTLRLHLSSFQDNDVSIFESSECLHGQPVLRSCICPLLFVPAWYKSYALNRGT